MRIEQLIFAVPAGLLLFALVAVLAVFLTLYGASVAAAPNVIKRVLRGLRSVALLAALLILADPYVSFRWEERAKPRVAVFIDVSKSMDQKDRLGHRGNAALQWMGILAREIGETAELERYAFATGVRPLRQAEVESLRFDGQGTNIACVAQFAIDSLDETRTAAVCLLTDGVHTVGADPSRLARRLRIPVFSVVFGDTSRTVDVALASVGGPEVAYVGRPFSVRVGIRKLGDVDYLGQLSAFRDSVLIFTRDLRLRPNESERWLTIELKPSRPGMARFQFRLSPLPGEVILSNNESELYVQVRPTRKRILLIGGEPSADFGFLRRYLQKDSTVELTSYCALGRHRWDPSPPWLEQKRDFDEVILVGFPAVDAPVPEQGLQWFRDCLATPKVVLFANRDFDGDRACDLLNLPAGTFFIRNRAAKPVYCEPIAGREFDPLLRLSESRSETARLWNTLPPVLATGWSVARASSAVPLLFGRYEDGQADTVGWVLRSGQRSVAFLGIAGFWQWGFAPLAFGSSTEVFAKLVANLANWSHVSNETAGLRVEPTQQVFGGNEPVRFRAFALNEDGTAVEDARVVVEIEGGRNREVLVLESQGHGVYEGTLASLPSGRYQYLARAWVGDRLLGESVGSFAVQVFPQELIEPRASLELPRRLARMTGGLAAVSSEAGAVVDSLHRVLISDQWRTLTLEKRSSWDLRHSWQALAVLLVALVAEWTIRRRSGLL